MLVDRQEAVRAGARKPADRRPGDARHGDDSLVLEVDVLRLDDEGALGRNLRERIRVQLHTGARQSVRDHLADRHAEHREWAPLGRHERELEVANIHALGTLRGHQRQLVQRQRPDGPDRLHECELARVAGLDVLHDSVVGGVGLGIAEGCHVLVRLHRAGADSDEQRVVLDAPATGRVHHLCVRVDPRQRVLRPFGIRVAHNPPQRIALGAAEREGSRTASGR